jgi:CO/xanthine dehydrogenase FAD-binding subunit
MRPFDYSSAATVEEAVALLGQNGRRQPLAGVQPLAGGTDLLTLMKGDVAAPSHLLDIKRLTGLPSGIGETPQGLTLGALTTLAEIETHPLIRQRYPLLAQAAAVAATPQLRNMATLGGNLLQRPRCWYFRNRLVDCWLKGGDGCPAYDVYLKAMERKVWAFALVAVAAAMRLDGRRVADARLVMGGVAPIPWQASVVEQALLGVEVGDGVCARGRGCALRRGATAS